MNKDVDGNPADGTKRGQKPGHKSFYSNFFASILSWVVFKLNKTCYGHVWRLCFGTQLFPLVKVAKFFETLTKIFKWKFTTTHLKLRG